MGSLTCGWNSPKSGRFERNKSLTKEEIDAYWNIKKKTEEEHLKAISTLDADRTTQSDTFRTATRDLILPNKSGWWTRSNSAFLNEPPVTELPTNTYVSQLHVTSLKVTPPPPPPHESGGVGA